MIILNIIIIVNQINIMAREFGLKILMVTVNIIRANQ
nr:MAG TPA: hypothetical protein [Crassvirales sp.]